jgi:hypothetical protein
VHPIDGIVNKAVALAEAFRARSCPHQCRRHSTWSR